MTWVKMDDKRAMHPKLCDAGFAARGLDEAAIELCATHETDGFIADKRLMMLGAAHGESPRSTTRLATILVDNCRWTRDDERGGYAIRDYLIYNPSKAELEAKRKADRDRKRPTLESEGIPDGIQQESDTDSDAPRGRARTGRVGEKAQRTALFEEFYAAFPLKKARPVAEKAFEKALRRADFETIMAGVERYKAEVRRTGVIIAHPASWLNADRWNDEAAAGSHPGQQAEDPTARRTRSALDQAMSALIAARKEMDPDLDTIAQLEAEVKELGGQP